MSHPHQAASDDILVPLLGEWTPGHLLPQLVSNVRMPQVPVPSYLITQKDGLDLYAVRVRGDIPAMLIQDTDVLVLRRATTWQDRQMVICRIDHAPPVVLAWALREGATVRLVAEQGGVELGHAPIAAVTVDAVVCGVMRSMVTDAAP